MQDIRKSTLLLLVSLSLVLVLGLFLTVLRIRSPRPPGIVPYDKTHPVWVSNDGVIDTYLDEYLFALASLGEIQLLGATLTTPFKPHNPWGHTEEEGYDEWLALSQQALDAARATGFKLTRPDGTPLAYTTAYGHIQAPVRVIDGTVFRTSDPQAIADAIAATEPARTPHMLPATEELLSAIQAHGTAEKPLLFMAAGPLTLIANAWLLARDRGIDITGAVIIAWAGGSDSDATIYNGWMDPWAAHIVLRHFRTVAFSHQWPVKKVYPTIRKADIRRRFPASPLRDVMVERFGTVVHGSRDAFDHDIDLAPATVLMQPHFVRSRRDARWVNIKPAEFATDDGRVLPKYEDAADGKHLVVTSTDTAAGARDFFEVMIRAITDARAGSGTAREPGDTDAPP